MALFYLHLFSAAEIAQMLGLKLEDLGSTLGAARARLQETMSLAGAARQPSR